MLGKNSFDNTPSSNCWNQDNLESSAGGKAPKKNSINVSIIVFNLPAAEEVEKKRLMHFCIIARWQEMQADMAKI